MYSQGRSNGRPYFEARELSKGLEKQRCGMFFFHDECDFVDDDQYDFFTLTLHIERRRNRLPKHNQACRRAAPVESDSRDRLQGCSAHAAQGAVRGTIN